LGVDLPKTFVNKEVLVSIQLHQGLMRKLQTNSYMVSSDCGLLGNFFLQNAKIFMQFTEFSIRNVSLLGAFR
jgi:hypothetical protein